MQTAIRPAAVALFLLAFCRPAAGEQQWSVYDTLSLGEASYYYNVASVYFSPLRDFTGSIAVGVSHTGTPVSDSGRSLGLGVSGAVGERMSASLDYLGYSGYRAWVFDPATMEIVGRSADRQSIHSLTAGAGLNVWEAEKGRQDPDALIGFFKLNGSVQFASHTIPLWILRATKKAEDWFKLGDYSVSDVAPSGGISVDFLGSIVGAAYTRHHYSFPDPPETLNRLTADVLFNLVRTSVSTALSSLPQYESVISLTEPLAEDFRIRASGAYTKMATDRSIARTVSGEVGLDANPSFEVRAGSFWVRQYKETARYTTLGVSIYF